jgi:hypothetical protein
MKRTLRLTVAVATILLLAACGGGTTETKTEAPAAAPPASAPPVDAASAATITGKVAFSGTKPVAKPISMDATPACAREHPTVPRSEEVVVNDNGTLRNAFVWVKSGLPDRQWPTNTEAAKLDQHTCIYKPHVLGVMTNQPIEIFNSDKTNHNIHPLPTVNREWNESQAPGSEKKTKSFPREEVMVAVKCNIHPWMRSYIGVVNHPFFSVTAEDGTFTLKGLPPGDYTIEAWHEKFGKQEQKITVGAKESKTADFDFKG